MKKSDVDAPRPEHSPTSSPREHSVERLLALLESVEKGSRELDGAVWMATRVRWNQANFFHWRHMLPKGDPQGTEQHYAEERAPSFTTSLDAALTLAGDRCIALSIDTAPGEGCCAHASVGRIHFGHAETLPLALVIAALKARSAK